MSIVNSLAMLKVEVATNKEKKCLNSWTKTPKIKVGSKICFSWTWKLKRKKAIETENNESKNCLGFGLRIDSF